MAMCLHAALMTRWRIEIEFWHHEHMGRVSYYRSAFPMRRNFHREISVFCTAMISTMMTRHPQG